MFGSRLLVSVCAAVTGLCPFICAIEAATHAERSIAAARPEPAANAPHHEHGAPHHQHDPCGEPISHSEHTCICAGGTPPGPGVHVPLPRSAPPAALSGAPAAATGAPDVRGLQRRNGPPTHPPNASWSLPLLI